MSTLLKKAKKLPSSPGIYLMKGKEQEILYVGKAKSLKKRVSNYFQKNHQDLKTYKLVENIHDFEVILVPTEEEALILERSSIRKYAPKFNILLRDDKEYPYLEVDKNASWPRIRKVRKKKHKDCSYFGPFTSGSSLNSLLHTIYEIFPLIRCSEYEFERRKKPCHYYHMKKCLAPCTLPVSPKSYQKIMKDVMRLLKDGNVNLEKSLEKKMKEASKAEEFELAASFRDQIEAFKKLRQKKKIIQTTEKNLDIIGLAEKKWNKLHQSSSYSIRTSR